MNIVKPDQDKGAVRRQAMQLRRHVPRYEMVFAEEPQTNLIRNRVGYTDQDRMGPADPGFRFININGRRVGVRVREGHGSPIIVLSGKGTSGSFYAPYVLDYLANTETVDPRLAHALGPRDTAKYKEALRMLSERPVIIADRPGIGYSNPFVDPDIPRTWLDLADEIHDIQEEVGLNEPPTLFCHSFGGLIGLAYHTKYGAKTLVNNDGSPIGVVALLESRLRDGEYIGSYFFDSEYSPPFSIKNLYERLDSSTRLQPGTGQETIFDLQAGYAQLREASYRRLPGIWVGKHQLAPTVRSDPDYSINWTLVGRELAQRLGMSYVVAGDHNPLITAPEVVRFGLVSAEFPDLNLNPRFFAALRGAHFPAEIDPALGQLVQISDLPGFLESRGLPMLPRGEPVNRNQLATSRLPNDLLEQIRRERRPAKVIDWEPKDESGKRDWTFPGSEQPIPPQVLPTVSIPDPGFSKSPTQVPRR